MAASHSAGEVAITGRANSLLAGSFGGGHGVTLLSIVAAMTGRGGAVSGTGFVGAPGGTRTPNLLIRSQVLYPLSYGRIMPTGKSTG